MGAYSSLGRYRSSAVVIAVGVGVVSSAFSDTFESSVKPILAQRCLECHGPAKQKGGLRLDSSLAIAHGGDNGPVVVANKPEASVLYQLISGSHADSVMPPKGEPLSAEEVAFFHQWITEGAPLPEDGESISRVESDHWSFQSLARPEVPAPTTSNWGHNEIDRFVGARLEGEAISPSPAADTYTLLRRLYLDLTGLPPEPADVDTFLADTRPEAYEELVDRLLASPHYGERWGRHWLDLARYADSDGYEKDSPRPFAYRYRDWVITALNEDMPYDQFVSEQLAGDLLPEATIAQRTATGFNRNTLTNREGGIDPEEDRVKQAVDRTNSVGSVFMGLTMACAQCHTHKYDPITQREYFGLYSFFNAALEEDVVVPLPGEEEAHAHAVQDHDAAVAAKEAELEAYRPKLAAGLSAWIDGLTVPTAGWTVQEPISYISQGAARLKVLEDQSILVSGDTPPEDSYTVVLRTHKSHIRGLRLEALTHKDLPRGGPGRASHANFVLNEITILAAPVDAPHNTTPVEIESATASFAQGGYPVEEAFDWDLNTGWAVGEGDKTSKDSAAQFSFATPVNFGQGTIFTITLAQRYGQFHNLGHFRLSLTTEDPARILYSDTVTAALLKDAASRSPEDEGALLHAFGQEDEEYQKLTADLAAQEGKAPKPIASTVMALKENPNPPVTRIHNRGDFLQPGAEVEPHTPAVLPPLTARGARPDRLDLARWIVDPENPLTARVAVNRVWEHLFGDGLARTSEDFGTRTEAPTHPELLDWLAVHFVEDHQWQTKSLIREIVLSATYRQASRIREDLLEQDPTNRLLARQNRFRVEAEITRDLFLAASGLLEEAVGGPSIRPPIPPGVVDLGYANQIKWPESEGPDKYRRGLYIFFQRTVAYPMLMTFDCPDSNVSTVARNRSNTPLQSLTLLNDPVFVEAAQALGQRLLQSGERDPVERVRQAFKLCMGREASEREVGHLVDLLAELEKEFAQAPEEAKALVGDYLAADVGVETAAAHMVLARAIMNLDEFVTRE